MRAVPEEHGEKFVVPERSLALFGEFLPRTILRREPNHRAHASAPARAHRAKPLIVLRPLGILLRMSDRPGTVRAVLRAACAALVLAALSGCGAPPQKEMDQAEGAIAAARAAGAAQYAAVEFAAAETALKRSHEAAAQPDSGNRSITRSSP